MAALVLSRNVVVSRFFKFRKTTLFTKQVRQITTSTKKKESTGTAEAVYKKVPDFSKPLENKNWVSYGYDFQNKDDDTFLFHYYVFCCFVIVVGGYIFLTIFYPDWKLRDWAQREAYIKLYEKEQLGLEPIDPNYVDPSKVILPPDSFLEEDDIII